MADTNLSDVYAKIIETVTGESWVADAYCADAKAKPMIGSVGDRTAFSVALKYCGKCDVFEQCSDLRQELEEQGLGDDGALFWIAEE